MVTLSWPNLHIFKKIKRKMEEVKMSKYKELSKEIIKNVGGAENNWEHTRQKK